MKMSIIIKKIILKTDNYSDVILFNYENPIFFNYLKLGDSLVKKKRTNEIRLYRNEIDTIIKLKFDYVKIYNTMRINPDSIIKNYVN
jgi:hypothetical protein